MARKCYIQMETKHIIEYYMRHCYLWISTLKLAYLTATAIKNEENENVTPLI